jgi:hypothetical protein
MHNSEGQVTSTEALSPKHKMPARIHTNSTHAHGTIDILVDDTADDRRVTRSEKPKSPEEKGPVNCLSLPTSCVVLIIEYA